MAPNKCRNVFIHSNKFKSPLYKEVMIRTTLLSVLYSAALFSSPFITRDLEVAKELSLYYQIPIVFVLDEAEAKSEEQKCIFVQVDSNNLDLVCYE